jgi:biopolymer transport protein ExbD
MAQLNVTEPIPKKDGIRQTKKTNLKIDMTPMVDLGFLLIAFFIFTTEISRPAVVKLYMPH